MKIAIFFLLLLSASLCRAESVFVGPYLGNALGSVRPPREVATAVKDADLVFVGRTTRLDTSGYNGVTGVGDYVADLASEQVLKGTFSGAFITLKWHPNTTGFQVGSKHIFFVKRKENTSEVLKEIFVHEPQTYPCCRTYGAMDGGTGITLDALSFFVSPLHDLPAGFGDRLLSEVKEDHSQWQATAVFLGYEVSRRECLPALLYAVENFKDYWLIAVYASCILDGEQGAKVALGVLDHPSSLSAGMKARVFDAIAKAANPAAVGPLKRLGDEQPLYRVSCAFAIRQLSSAQLPAIIKAWLADHKHDGKVETVSTGYYQNTYSVESLLNDALQGKTFSSDFPLLQK